MNEIFNPNKVHIRVMDLELYKETAESYGIIKVHNSATHKDWFDKNPFINWSKKLIDDPNNLLLNRLDGNVVISSLIEFRDEFSLNLFSMRRIYVDMEGGMICLQKSFLN